MTAYDDQVITYDGVGNPLQYYNGRRWTFTWTDGRKLVGAQSTDEVTGETTEVSYTYGVDGTRYDKTVNGVTHYYIWADGKPLKEYVAGSTGPYTSGDTLFFFYDQNGRPYALQYNGSTYYYVLNLQGDVIWLVDGAGSVVASYEYDPYGNIISASGTMAQINPLRYRGYYYDAETGLYYLNSRYYDPAGGRFLNADGYITTGQDVLHCNMYAYCLNDPINRVDYSGNGSLLLNWWMSTMGWLCAVDSILPIGDTIYLAGLLLFGVAAISSYSEPTALLPTMTYKPKEEKTKEKEKVNVTSESKPQSTTV